MFFAIPIYVIAVIIVFAVLNKRKTFYCELPKLNIHKNGIKFYSTQRHRLYIWDAKIMQVRNNVYLKYKNKMLIVKNVDKVYYKSNFIYFNSLGICEIVIDLKKIYRYFQIEIMSTQFDIENYKQKAISGICNNLFNLNNSNELKEYINIVKNILKVNVNEKQISIKQNQFKIPFELKYVCNNRVKKIKINQNH